MLNTFYDKFIFTNALHYRNNNFYLMNVPFLIMPNELLVGIASHENVEVNRDIYYAVKEATGKVLVKQFELDFATQLQRSLHFVEEYFTASGWGLLTPVQVDVENKRAIISVANSPFALPLLGKVKSEVDHFLRGVLAGLFANAFKAEVECVETECHALKGHGCKFVIQTAEHIDFSGQQARNQLRVTV